MPYAGIDRNQYQLHVGSQSPRTGNRFAGIITYYGGSDYPNYCEYIQVALNEALVAGNYYCAEMYVSLGEYEKFAANNLGMCFSEDLVDTYPHFGALNYKPQIVEKRVILDSINWIKISGAFKATSNAKYLIIGNFSDNDETNIVEISGRSVGPPSYYDYAYYFIDDVSVQAIAAPAISVSDDQSICQGAFTSIAAAGNFETIEWTTLEDTTTILGTDKNLYVQPLATTRYRAKGHVCELQVLETVTVQVIPFKKPDLGKDTVICEGSTLRLHPSTQYSSYTWSDNSVASYLDISLPGKYTLTAKSEEGCKGKAEINVSMKRGPEVDLGNDTLVCKEPIQLRANEGIPAYHWSTGGTESSITISDGGTYWVIVANECGQDQDSIQVESHKDLFIPNVVTLNGDGLNDRFEITGLGPTNRGDLKIFNRLGEVLFSEREYDGGWPIHTSLPDTGVYYYTLDYGCAAYRGWIRVLK